MGLPTRSQELSSPCALWPMASSMGIRETATPLGHGVKIVRGGQGLDAKLRGALAQELEQVPPLL